MKTTFLTLTVLAVAAFATPASALTIFGLEVTAPVAKTRCHNIEGNWNNVAEKACSDNGSGGIGLNSKSKHSCKGRS